MKGFDTSFIEKLKDKLDIVDVIGKYCELKKNGRNFWACCPFHHEKTPSFSVNQTEQFYHCFGCGKSGDIITFIMEEENLDFIEAVKLLAKEANLEVPEIDYDNEEIKKKREKKERLLSLLRETARFYAKNLRSEQAYKHYNYLVSRGVSNQTINRFGIGASLNANGLINHLSQLNYTKEEMYQAGVAGKKEDYYYDFLRERLIIPVINNFDQVIGFCGRILEPKGFGKYVNTPDTIIFTKGNNLFGINILKKLKKEKTVNTVILVEGHMDVISLVSHGYENALASMGTAFTQQQANLIKKYAENVILCYDGDQAGTDKAITASQILEKSGLNVKVMCIPNDADPDDVIVKQGKETFENLMEQALPPIDFKLYALEKKSNLQSIDGKRSYIKKAIAIIKESSSPSVQEELIKQLSKKCKISYDSLKRELEGVKQEPQEQKITATTKELSPLQYAENVILWAIIFNKSYAKISDLTRVEFSSPERKKIVQSILVESSYGKAENKKIEPNMLFEMVEEDLQQELSPIFGMESEEKISEINEEKLYNDCVKKVIKENYKQQINALKEQFALEEDTEKRKEIAVKLQQKIKESMLV